MRSVTLLLLQLSAVLAAPVDSRSEYRVFSSHSAPREWHYVGRPDPEHSVNLRIGLKQSSFEELERELYEVSDPASDRYGNHLSMAEVHPYITPSADSHNAVHEWLAEHGIGSNDIEYSAAKDWIIVTLPVWRVEKLLDTEYHQYGHEVSGKQIVRTPKYSLPRLLHDHIDTIQPTNYFGNWRLFSEDFKLAETLPLLSDVEKEVQTLAAAAAGVPTSCVTNSQAVTLQCYRDFYGTSSYTPQVPTKNLAGTTNYLGQVPSTADFRLFMTTNRPGTSTSYTFTTFLIANASNDQTMPGVEADLDVELVGGFSVPTPFNTYSTGGSPPYLADSNTPTDTNEPYLTWLNYILQQTTIPYLISTSYGDDEQSVPLDYATRVCSEFSQLGARGVTLLFSSGDNGVGTNGSCVSNDGTNTRKFLPAFPASCPYVTTVGGTRDFSPEQIAFDTGNGFVAGSGFSNYFARPSYQSTAVSAYLKSIGSLNKGLYNATGRAYPDISAQSYRFALTNMGITQPVDGTSVASPLAAGILTLINDALLAKGKSPLGFLNPMLYSTKGKGFNDVVTGRSTGCDTSGFPALKGWDVASGYGTPNFTAIRASLGV